MGYVKKSLQRINEILDNETEKQKNWDKFIEEASKTENILIKRKNKHLYCTNCKKEYKYTRKPKITARCHFCHQELEVKGANLKNLTYLKDLIVINRVNDEYVLRIYQLRSDYTDLDFERSIVEYARYFLDSNVEVISQNVCRTMGSTYVNRNENCKYSTLKWRTFNSYWSNLSCYGKLYHYNLKDLFKGTQYQYCHLWELAKNMDCINVKSLMSYEIERKSFELLVKAKLYNLALKSGHYNNAGNFEQRFGVPKDFYPFMVKHNINEDELVRLKLLREPNINKLRYLLKYQVYALESVEKYVKMSDFINYSKRIKKFDIDTYKDYLEFCDKLGFNMKDKKILFPKTKKELNKKHDELMRQYEIRKDKIINDSIKKRYEELKVNTYKDKQFIIKPAATIKSLIDESKQQNNCIRTYAEKYAEGVCDIYFVRLLKYPKKSLITVEVVNNEVVQCRMKNNEAVTKQQQQWLEKWQENILKKKVNVLNN